jgi:hypothetical protein
MGRPGVERCGKLNWWSARRRPSDVIRYTASMDLEPDIVEQLRRDFAEAAVPTVARQLLATTKAPRVQRCIVFAARGHRWFLDYLCRLAKSDWRDVIMTAEHARSDPQLRLYDFNKPIPAARIDDPMAFHDFSKPAK